MRFWKLLLPLLASSLCLAAQSDRIAGAIDASHTIALHGNVHGLAAPEFDQGRVEGSRTMIGVSLVFKPSGAQQSALNKLLAQQQDPSSPNYRKWLTPAQFAYRFGMSDKDIGKATSWLQSQGFTITRIANSRNQIFFEGTVGQIEAAFRTEIHYYLVDGELHYANAQEPSVPAALADIALAVQNLHNFQPKPRAVFRKMSADEAGPNFTSHVSGNHFVAPGDFATIYDTGPLYSANIDGTGQTIALTGQSSISLTDVANFRSAAGLPVNVPTLLLMPGTGTSTRCSGDEGESDLDVEWSGAVAKNASITLVYAGPGSGKTCATRVFGAFDALQYAIDQNIALVISNSYGACESDVGNSFALTMQGWIQQANAQGQTVISASGDSGAADCDFQAKTGTKGLAVDIPAAIPEVTGMGGTEFNGDAEATITGGNANATPYWSGTTGGTDTISSALSYIPEMGWNDTTNPLNTGGQILASGGGASIFFAKPSWQTGTGVPSDGKRDVPDLALNSSPIHDSYLFCSEDGATVPSCSSSFRNSNNNLSAVGGTSAAAPTFAGIVALLNQYLGASGLGNVNPNLYALAASDPAAFNDVTTGDNIVPCTSGTTGCPVTAPFQYGFTAGTGYDQVTGLGSVDAYKLAQAWGASRAATTTTIAASSPTAYQDVSVTFTATIAPSTATGKVTFFNNGSTTPLGTAVISNGTATFATAALPAGTDSVTATYSGDKNDNTSSSASAVTVNVTQADVTLTTTASTFPVSVGGTAAIPITVVSPNGFINTSNNTTILALTYSCSGIPASAEISCQPPNGGQPDFSPTVTLNLVTTPVTTQLRPLGRSRIFYAVLLPGLFGIVFVAGSRTRALRVLSCIVVLSCSTLWLGACGGGSNSNSRLKNAGTPPGQYAVTITATTGGANPITASLPITLNVTQSAGAAAKRR